MKRVTILYTNFDLRTFDIVFLFNLISYLMCRTLAWNWFHFHRFTMLSYVWRYIREQPFNFNGGGGRGGLLFFFKSEYFFCSCQRCYGFWGNTISVSKVMDILFCLWHGCSRIKDNVVCFKCNIFADKKDLALVCCYVNDFLYSTRTWWLT